MLLLAALAHVPCTGEARLLAGHVEQVRVDAGALLLDARVDTGAQHSSLHATRVQRFERDGTTWVRFTVTPSGAAPTEIERPLLRVAQIRRHAGASQEREVITLALCLGGVHKQAEVNLVDRSGFDYPLLIGRSFLAGDFLVDPAARFLLRPDCQP